jgi:hypothetical protein
VFFQQGHPVFGVFTALLGAAVGFQQYYLSRTFAAQLIRLERSNPEAVRRYLHQWWICKNPSTCPRCRGWLGGLIAGTGAWIVGAVVYGFNPEDLINHLGLPATYALAIVFLFLTPIHGMLGRLGKVRKESIWEGKEMLEAIGFLSALSAPIFAAIAYAVWSR